MFEQTILANGNSGRRFWSACVGVTGEALVLAFAVVAPMVWPQVLPFAKDRISLYTPTVPRPLSKAPKPTATHAGPRSASNAPHPFTAPAAIPPRAAILSDPPVDMARAGAPGGLDLGSEPGIVNPAVLVHRVEPRYPPLARQARISGVVELECVIGIDGRMKEIAVRGGHPLLVTAAVEAVRQWVYRPTRLNGEPVEVIAPITVTFTLAP